MIHIYYLIIREKLLLLFRKNILQIEMY